MLKYREQIQRECQNSNCLKIFCRHHHNTKLVNEVSSILEEYSTIFYCENIDTLLSGSVKPLYAHRVLDLFFYIDSLLYTSYHTTLRSACQFSLRKGKSDKSLLMRNCRTANKKRFKILPSKELEHAYCTLLNPELLPTDVFLLIGVVHLLLKKFESAPNVNNALIIIRLFAIISKSSCLESQYYALLLDVYDFLFRKFNNSIIGSKLVEGTPCRAHSQCLFQLKLSSEDLRNSVEAIADALNASIITSTRESPKIKSLLSIFRILYEINAKAKVFSYERFYLNNFCSKINLKTEYKFLRSSYETALRHHFILPVWMKAELLKIENREIMKATLQDAFFRSLFEGVTEPYLFMAIHRNSIYKDTLEIVRALRPTCLRKQLKIQFIGEEGIDSGGIRKEYFQLLSLEISSDPHLFNIRNNRVWFKPGANLEVLSLVGKLIGMALYNDIVINVPISFLCFKKLLNVPLTFADLEEIEPEHHRSLLNLQNCTAAEFKGSDLYFTALDSNNNTVDLVANGSRIPVTKKNFVDFQRLYAEYYTDKLTGKEFEAFMNGFFTTVSRESIHNLQPKELEKIIIGLEEFDFEIIRKTTTYNGYCKDSRIIHDFWSVVENYNFLYKKKLLQFITGNDRLPVAGSKSLRLTILRNGCDTERLPSSQTCFNTLLLPEYSSKEKLAKKLSKALKLTAGFFLI